MQNGKMLWKIVWDRLANLNIILTCEEVLDQVIVFLCISPTYLKSYVHTESIVNIQLLLKIMDTRNNQDNILWIDSYKYSVVPYNGRVFAFRNKLSLHRYGLIVYY